MANMLKLYRNGAVGFIDRLRYGLQGDDGTAAVTGAAVSKLPYYAFS